MPWWIEAHAFARRGSGARIIMTHLELHTTCLFAKPHARMAVRGGCYNRLGVHSARCAPQVRRAGSGCVRRNTRSPPVLPCMAEPHGLLLWSR